MRQDLVAFFTTQQGTPRSWSFTEDDLLHELPAYELEVRDRVFTQGLTSENIALRMEEIHLFWQDVKEKLPKWYALYCIVAIIAPSSASVERVFSILKNVFTKSNTHAYCDVIRLAVMLQYNSKQLNQDPDGAGQDAGLI